MGVGLTDMNRALIQMPKRAEGRQANDLLLKRSDLSNRHWTGTQ